MKPTIHDTTLYQGSERTYVYTLTNSLAAPLNLTGCKVIWGVKKTIDSSTYLVKLTSDSGRILIDALNGKITIPILASDTNAIHITGDEIECVHQAEIQDVNGNFLGTPGDWFRFMMGSCTLNKQLIGDN